MQTGNYSVILGHNPLESLLKYKHIRWIGVHGYSVHGKVIKEKKSFFSKKIKYYICQPFSSNEIEKVFDKQITDVFE